MVRDLLQELPSGGSRADVCIVGAGAAGICLAIELGRAGKRVLLLEGGGSTIEDAAQEPYRSELAGLPHRGVHEGRFRAHGGTTHRWGGQILELDDHDFAPKDWVPGSGWPISKAELLPCYERALHLEGLAGALREDEAVWRRLRVNDPWFADLALYLSRWCPEPNFSALHGPEIAASPNIELWLHAAAVGLDLDQDTLRGLRVRTQTGREATFRAERFVFAMGAIECSRFFLQPRHDSPPWQRSGLLGRHFQDHIDCSAATVQPYSRAELHRCFDGILLAGHKYQPKLRLKPQSQHQHRLLNIGATLAFEHDDAEELAQLRTSAKKLLRGRLRELGPSDWRLAAKHCPNLLRQTFRYTVQHRSWQPSSARILLRVHCEQEPLSRSSITLAGERDSLGLLRTRLDWRISPAELRSIRSFVALAAASLAGLARVTPLPELDSDEALLRACQDSFHHIGGMRMHPSPSHGLVDTDLKLHGVANGWVCSSAVFPTGGFSNPTHTLLALAVRLGDRLRQDAAVPVVIGRQNTAPVFASSYAEA